MLGSVFASTKTRMLRSVFASTKTRMLRSFSASPMTSASSTTDKTMLGMSEKGKLASTSPVSMTNLEIFEKYLAPAGVNWSNVPSELKKLYLEEFKKTYTWDENVIETKVVKKLWTKQAAGTYRDMVYRVKRDFLRNGRIPDYIEPPVLAGWRVYWETQEAIGRSNQTRKNRFSKPVQPGRAKVAGKTKTLLQPKAAFLDCILHKDVRPYLDQFVIKIGLGAAFVKIGKFTTL